MYAILKLIQFINSILTIINALQFILNNIVTITTQIKVPLNIETFEEITINII